jgi:peptidoglycan/xylan/chitin deacetylase (PgdA/CDA1 family)
MGQPARYLKWLYPRALWRIKTRQKKVYLTFDDGPVPEATPWVIDTLAKYHIKATFFCVGENVWRYPHIYQQLIDNGHQTGNHTFNHLRATKVSHKGYFENIEKAAQYVKSNLFRPPHGEIYPWQMRSLKKRFKEVVLWDVLTYDYNQSKTVDQIVDNIKRYTRPGSILLFHDSVKAWPNMHKALPIAIEWLLKEGYTFETIS